MNKVYVPTTGPADWQPLLAEPEKHWKPGYSAYALATCWEKVDGLPMEVRSLFVPYFSDVELLLAIPEYKVPLPGRGNDSQNDLFCLLRTDDKTMAMMVEGKVEEPFDKPLSVWLAEASDNKRVRLSYLAQTLGLKEPIPLSIWYQLLHRSASAVITARRFGAHSAAMVVHSFSPAKTWLNEFKAFAALWNKEIEHDQMVLITLPDGFELFLGWATGQLHDGVAPIKSLLSGTAEEKIA